MDCLYIQSIANIYQARTLSHMLTIDGFDNFPRVILALTYMLTDIV